MESIETIAQRLRLEGVSCRTNEPMKHHTTFRIGGPAAFFAEPQDIPQLTTAIKAARQNQLAVFFLGQGSNVLFADEGYNGMVISLGDALTGIKLGPGNQLTAGAGENLAAVCREAQWLSLTGLEFAYGIPGSVGGAVFMNAGAFDGDMKKVLTGVAYLDENGEERTASVDELELGYRQSVFQKQPWCIMSATYQLAPGDKTAIGERMDHLMQQRIQKQPLELPSAGSAFKRPEGAFAGALIDECGLRGYRVGDAAISEKHCGFIVNLGEATCAEVLALAEHVSRTVKEKTGFILEKEIRVINSP